MGGEVLRGRVNSARPLLRVGLLALILNSRESAE